MRTQYYYCTGKQNYFENGPSCERHGRQKASLSDRQANHFNSVDESKVLKSTRHEQTEKKRVGKEIEHREATDGLLVDDKRENKRSHLL